MREQFHKEFKCRAMPPGELHVLHFVIHKLNNLILNTWERKMNCANNSELYYFSLWYKNVALMAHSV